MSNVQGAATVDSLVKFSYKKKFSFANKLKNEEEINQELSSSASSSSEDEKKKSKNQPKGSAKLKQKTKKKNSSDDESSTDSSSNSSESSIEKKKKSKKSNHANKQKKNKFDSDCEEEDEKREKQLKKLYEMFFDQSPTKIKNLFITNNFNAKKCIDILLKEKSNDDETDHIEEWSDGDEKIRAKNREAKEKRISNESSKSSSSIKSSSTTTSSLNEKKRKHDDEDIIKEPLKKKSKKLIVHSDSDENDVDEPETKTNNVNKINTSLNNSIDEVPKKKAKTKFMIHSTDEDNGSDYEEKKTASKKNKNKKKKEKKEKKKKEDSESNQDDDDFNQSDASKDTDDSGNEEELTDEQKAAILSLYNDSSSDDIQSMMNISQKRLEVLISLRPFKSFRDLEKRLSEKSLGQMITNAKDIIYARSIVSNLLNKCLKISEKMEKKVTSLIDGGQNSESDLEIKFQPKILNKSLSLKPYQLIGLNWLCLLHKENINGILADEMGLGKTCQTISFLSHLLETNPEYMHLIVVPPSTLDNWVREISTWCPSFNFTVYQGSLEERRHLRFNILNNKFEKKLNAILSTYNLLHSTNEDKAFFKKIKFEYCVFDEAHMLKNMNSIRYQSLIKIRSKRKLLLTGTPLQNNMVELMSLLYFVMPDIFHHKTQYLNKIFASKPASVDKDTFYSEKIKQAKGIMKPFILRRVKTEVLKQLPAKTEEIIFCDMTQRQNKEYTNLITYYKKRKDQVLKETNLKLEQEQEKLKNITKQKYVDEIFDIIQTDTKNRKEIVTEKKIKENEDNTTNILMELRKAANHPLLRRTLYDDEKLKVMAKLVLKESSPDTVYEYVLEDMSVMSDFQLHKLCPLYKCLKGHELTDQNILDSGKFTVLDSILAEKKEMGDRVLIFSQFVIMLDILEDYLKIKSYQYVRLDGSTAVNERQDLIDEYNNNNEIFVFLLSTKAGGMGINLTAANVVILHDIDYNPFNDKQAEDRCHRVGQTKEVQVYKLLSKNTIDEMMLKIQKKKLELGADLSGQNDENQSKSDMVSMLKEALKI